MVEIVKHAFVKNPMVPASPICSLPDCKQPKENPVHRTSPVPPTVVHGTAHPTKVG